MITVDEFLSSAQAGGTAPAVLNGANEVCVEAFLQGRLPFTGIVSTVSNLVDEHLDSGWISGGKVSVADVLDADRWARSRVQQVISG